MEFGEEVKRLRELKGLSQIGLSQAVGVNQTFISKVERGDRPGVGAEVLYRLCDALGVGCDHFRPFLAPADTTPPPPVEKPKRGRPKKET